MENTHLQTQFKWIAQPGQERSRPSCKVEENIWFIFTLLVIITKDVGAVLIGRRERQAQLERGSKSHAMRFNDSRSREVLCGHSHSTSTPYNFLYHGRHVDEFRADVDTPDLANFSSWRHFDELRSILHFEATRILFHEIF